MMPIYMRNAPARILILPIGETRSRFRSDNPSSGLSHRSRPVPMVAFDGMCGGRIWGFVEKARVGRN